VENFLSRRRSVEDRDVYEQEVEKLALRFDKGLDCSGNYMIKLVEKQIRFIIIFFLFFSPGATQPIVGVYFTALYRVLASSRTRLLDHIKQHATVGMTPLNEWSVRRRDLCLTTHNTHNRQISMPRVGFEPTIAAGERKPYIAHVRPWEWNAVTLRTALWTVSYL
jgi:hypothetical protein